MACPPRNAGPVVLRSAGIATIIAAGNDASCASVSGPGCISTAVAVGAATDSDGEASFSNYQATLLDLYAPGVNILSSVNTSDFGYDGTISGTSMASPHVAGAWAILKQADPGADVATLLGALQTTGKPVSGRCLGSPTQRRIQIDRALRTGRTQFNQPPDAAGESNASNMESMNMTPNVLLADDFLADGRPITKLRWWGGNLSLGEGTSTPSNETPTLSPHQFKIIFFSFFFTAKVVKKTGRFLRRNRSSNDSILLRINGATGT
jgi:hypothetical protein